MNDYLVKHAIDNVWCNPKQDSQLILKPARLTPYGGVKRSWKTLWTSFNLPNNTNTYHVYSVGQIHPLLVNLFPISTVWSLVSESNMITDTITEIYTQKGLRIPVTQTYYIVTEEKSLLFAVKKDAKLDWDFNNEPIYIRMYDNAYFESVRNTGPKIFVAGKTVNSTTDITDLQIQYQAKNVLAGKVFVFVNGYRAKDVSLLTVTIGDTVEFHHDPSVLNTYEFALNTLLTFDSVLDTKRKYLIRPVGDIGNNIYYQDDVDIYIKHPTTKKGVYFHKNSEDNLRMVTHRDYSVGQSVVSVFLGLHPDKFDYSNAVVEINVRQSGYQRPLVNEHSRIKELYKLTDEQIQAAMIGVESSLDIWRVDSLENSNYTKVMRSAFSEVTKPLVKDTYGYNAVVKLMADPVIKTEIFNSQRIARLPFRYMLDATLYEFDSAGIYTDKYYQAAGEIYNCVDSTAGYVLAVHGTGDDTLDEYYNVQSVVMDPDYEYRFYKALKDEVYPNTVWTDVTGSEDYILAGNTATWTIMTTHDVLVRSNKKHLSKRLYLDASSGGLTFNISHMQDIDGTPTDAIMQVPMGELKVFLNGRALVRNLDYHVDFPVITIVNKDYLIDQNTTQQRIDYIFTGLCDSDLNFSTYAESGFIKNGYLSVDDRFDIRDDKANFIMANGRIYVKEDLSFLEDSHTFVFDSVLNGKPYCIEDAIVPIKEITGVDTYEYKALSTEVDIAVSDYLTLRIPPPTVPELNPIVQYYKLYSPFISKVIFAVIGSAIDPVALTQFYNDDRVRELVEPYVYLLDMDPIHPDRQPNRNYCIIHPHVMSNVVEVNIYQHKFITRVVNIYGNGLINLSGHLILV
jgi:hypothetical protein